MTNHLKPRIIHAAELVDLLTQHPRTKRKDLHSTARGAEGRFIDRLDGREYIIEIRVPIDRCQCPEPTESVPDAEKGIVCLGCDRVIRTGAEIKREITNG
jgi:hypothetical protein